MAGTEQADSRVTEIAVLGERWKVRKTNFSHTERTFFEIHDTLKGTYHPQLTIDQESEEIRENMRVDWWGQEAMPLDAFVEKTHTFLLGQNEQFVVEPLKAAMRLHFPYVEDIPLEELHIDACLINPTVLPEAVAALTDGKDPALLKVITNSGVVVGRSSDLGSFVMASPVSTMEDPHVRQLSGEFHEVNTSEENVPITVFQESIDAVLADFRK
jgi:hypothetical protein